MPQESEFDIIREKLNAADKIPAAAWDKQAAWGKLEDRLAGNKKKPFNVWLYTGLAAALVLLGIAITWHLPDSTTLTLTGIRPITSKTIAAPLPNTDTRPLNQVSTTQNTKTVAGRPVHHLPTEEAGQVADEAFILTKERVTKHDSAPATIFYRISAPEVVYTLNEIMDNVPEREAPPQNYTGIFKLKPLNPGQESRRVKESMSTPPAFEQGQPTN